MQIYRAGLASYIVLLKYVEGATFAAIGTIGYSVLGNSICEQLTNVDKTCTTIMPKFPGVKRI